MFTHKTYYFPHPLTTRPSGVLAQGGDLHPDRLLLAYAYGVFPWFHPREQPLWWYPNPRCVLDPNKVKIAKSMRPYFNQRRFDVSYNTAFEEVILKCKSTFRPGQGETWISPTLIQSYLELYQRGCILSVEVWDKELLVGGLYGVVLGKVFFGESMFASVSNASKYGFISLCKKLSQAGFELIDCQITTPHLLSLGAEEISRDDFRTSLRENQLFYMRHGNKLLDSLLDRTQ